MFAPAPPASPTRRNLDYAFPPFASGLPSVYERAGFDVNPSVSRSRSGSRSSSVREGSFSGSSAGSNASLRSQGSTAALPQIRDASPLTPASQYSQFEPELQKPLTPLVDTRRPSSPLVNEASLPKKLPAQPRLNATPNPYASTPSISVAGPSNPGQDGPAVAGVEADSVPAPAPAPASAPQQSGPTHFAPPSTASSNVYRGEPGNFAAAQSVPGPLSVDTSANVYNGKSQTSSPEQQTHSQSASDASTATSDFEFLDTKPALNTMPLNIKPAWAQAQDRAPAQMPQSSPSQPPPNQQTPYQRVPDQRMPHLKGSQHWAPDSVSGAAPSEREQRIYAPQALHRPGNPAANYEPPRAFLGVPQADLNRMSTTSSIYSNRASTMPQSSQREPLPRDQDSVHGNENLASSSGLYDESESSVSFDFADSSRPTSVPQAETSLRSQGSGNSQSSGKKRKYCRGCLNPIIGKSVRSRDGTLSGRWHRDCFMCTRCEAPLTGLGSEEVHVHEDQPFCPGCYHVVAHTTCRMCGKGIEGSCLEASAETGGSAPLLYHVNCLRCAECQIHLQQSYFEVDGATYCAEHAFTSLPQNTEVHKRFTQFMMI